MTTEGSGKKSRKNKGIAKVTAGSYGALSSGLQAMGHAMKASSGDSNSIIPALFYAGLAGLSAYGINRGVKDIKKSKKGNGYEVKISEIKKELKKHPLNKPIHVNDIIKYHGKAKKHVNKVRNILSGDGFISDYLNKDRHRGGGLKKSFHSARKKLHKFFNGETKYKPSDLLNHISIVTGASSSFLGPEMMIPSLAAKMGSDFVKSKGKGISLPGNSSRGSGVNIPDGGNGINLAGKKPTTKPYKKKCPCDVKKMEGGTIKMTGYGKKKRKKPPNKWNLHLMAYKKIHPEKSLKQCMKDAKASYVR